MVQVLPERACVDLRLQVAIGGSYHADVGPRMRAVGADALQLAGFEKPEQRALHPGAHLADFVQKERSVRCGFEQSRLVTVGACETAANVSEHLRFKQRVRHPGAVETGKRRQTPRASRVNQARDDILAGAGFARNEHLCVGARRKDDVVAKSRERRAAADESSR